MNRFDLAISMCRLVITRFTTRAGTSTSFPIHDYFFAATLDKLRPGGLMMFITSRHAGQTGFHAPRAWPQSRIPRCNPPAQQRV